MTSKYYVITPFVTQYRIQSHEDPETPLFMPFIDGSFPPTYVGADGVDVAPFLCYSNSKLVTANVYIFDLAGCGK